MSSHWKDCFREDRISKLYIKNTAGKDNPAREYDNSKKKTREENEKEKIIKHSAFAVHGAGADAADGVCGYGKPWFMWNKSYMES